jgi:predicted glutamine amidotransferase
MCRLLAYATRSQTTIPEFIGPEFSGFVDLSNIHKDSWGLAFDSDQKMRVEKTPGTAAQDSQFSQSLQSHPSTGALLHFRWASPGLAVTQENAHPFAYQDISLIHNGAITPYGALEPLVAPEFLSLREGTTDTELYFLFLLTYIKKFGFLAGVNKAIETIRAQFTYSSINSMIMNKDYLIVLSEHDPENKPSWADEIYYELRYRVDENGIAVASSGWNQDGWTLMPNHSLLTFNRNDFSHILRAI